MSEVRLGNRYVRPALFRYRKDVPHRTPDILHLRYEPTTQFSRLSGVRGSQHMSVGRTQAAVVIVVTVGTRTAGCVILVLAVLHVGASVG